MVDVNDVHSLLNRSEVFRAVRPTSVEAVRDAVLLAGRQGGALAIAGGRHAMGGQQFLHEADLLDMTGLDRVIDFDPDVGQIEVEAGIMWPALVEWLHAAQHGRPSA